MKYWSVFQLSLIHGLKNRKALIGLSIFLVTCLVIFANLWQVATSSNPRFLPSELLWYIAFNEWVLIAIPDIQLDIEQDLRSGKLAYLLPRPISYLGSTFADAFGILIGNLLILGIVAFSFTFFRIGSFPCNIQTFIIALLLGVLAGAIAIIFQMCVGLSAFWLREVAPLSWIWEKLSFTLGGLILPLSIYPEWLKKLAYLTPFPAILGERSALSINCGETHIFQILSSLLIWGAIGFAFLTLLFRRGLRIVNIEGG